MDTARTTGVTFLCSVDVEMRGSLVVIMVPEDVVKLAVRDGQHTHDVLKWWIGYRGAYECQVGIQILDSIVGG